VKTVITTGPASGGQPTQPGIPGSTQILPIGSDPTKGVFGDLTLSQRVDATVAPSQLGHNAPIPGFNVPASFDINALPATAAGPSDLLGFPVIRVSQDEALRTGGSDAPALGGHWLFVYHGIPNMQLSGEGIGSVRIPEDAFAHTDPTAIVHLEARLLNGSPLPSWLKFEGIRGQFTGVPPEGASDSLEIEVIARDTNGREARALFVLLVEDLRNGERLRTQEVPDLMLGLDVDAKEAEKARLKAEAEKVRLQASRQAIEGRQADKAQVKGDGKPQKEAVASFTDQVRAAKATRDPLLDKIARSGPGTPGHRS
jgi:hypothetical protein